jgi:hypothetical protein
MVNYEVRFHNLDDFYEEIGKKHPLYGVQFHPELYCPEQISGDDTMMFMFNEFEIYCQILGGRWTPTSYIIWLEICAVKDTKKNKWICGEAYEDRPYLVGL